MLGMPLGLVTIVVILFGVSPALLQSLCLLDKTEVRCCLGALFLIIMYGDGREVCGGGLRTFLLCQIGYLHSTA